MTTDDDGNRADLLGDVIRSVTALVDRHYPGAGYACVVVHLRDDVPDVYIPVTSPHPIAEPLATS